MSESTINQIESGTSPQEPNQFQDYLASHCELKDEISCKPYQQIETQNFKALENGQLLYRNSEIMGVSRVEFLRRQEQAILMRRVHLNHFDYDRYDSQIDRLIQKKETISSSIDLLLFFMPTEKIAKVIRNIPGAELLLEKLKNNPFQSLPQKIQDYIKDKLKEKSAETFKEFVMTDNAISMGIKEQILSLDIPNDGKLDSLEAALDIKSVARLLVESMQKPGLNDEQRLVYSSAILAFIDYIIDQNTANKPMTGKNFKGMVNAYFSESTVSVTTTSIKIQIETMIKPTYNKVMRDAVQDPVTGQELLNFFRSMVDDPIVSAVAQHASTSKKTQEKLEEYSLLLYRKGKLTSDEKTRLDQLKKQIYEEYKSLYGDPDGNQELSLDILLKGMNESAQGFGALMGVMSVLDEDHAAEYEFYNSSVQSGMKVATGIVQLFSSSSQDQVTGTLGVGTGVIELVTQFKRAEQKKLPHVQSVAVGILAHISEQVAHLGLRLQRLDEILGVKHAIIIEDLIDYTKLEQGGLLQLETRIDHAYDELGLLDRDVMKLGQRIEQGWRDEFTTKVQGCVERLDTEGYYFSLPEDSRAKKFVQCQDSFFDFLLAHPNLYPEIGGFQDQESLDVALVKSQGKDSHFYFNKLVAETNGFEFSPEFRLLFSGKEFAMNPVVWSEILSSTVKLEQVYMADQQNLPGNSIIAENQMWNRPIDGIYHGFNEYIHYLQTDQQHFDDLFAEYRLKLSDVFQSLDSLYEKIYQDNKSKFLGITDEELKSKTEIDLVKFLKEEFFGLYTNGTTQTALYHNHPYQKLALSLKMLNTSYWKIREYCRYAFNSSFHGDEIFQDHLYGSNQLWDDQIFTLVMLYDKKTEGAQVQLQKGVSEREADAFARVDELERIIKIKIDALKKGYVIEPFIPLETAWDQFQDYETMTYP